MWPDFIILAKYLVALGNLLSVYLVFVNLLNLQNGLNSTSVTSSRSYVYILGLIISLVSIRNISRAEEIFVDYGYDGKKSNEDIAWYFDQVKFWLILFCYFGKNK